MALCSANTMCGLLQVLLRYPYLFYPFSVQYVQFDGADTETVTQLLQCVVLGAAYFASRQAFS